MSYPAKKTTLLHELESAIKRKTQEKNRHRDIANKNLQYSIEKKKVSQGSHPNNQSRERIPSASTHKNSKHHQIHIQKKAFDNKPISLFNNLHSQGNGFVSQQIKESLAKESIAHAAKLKKTNSKKLDKLVSLINYALSSAEKIIKYMNASSFQGEFAIKLFRSDKQNLLNQLKNLTVEDIIQHRDRNNNSVYNLQRQSKDKDLNQLIIDLQNDNIKLKSKIANLEKQSETIGKTKFFEDIFQVPTGKLKETQRFKQTLQLLTGVNYTKKILEILQKQTKFEIISLKSAGNNRKIMEVQAILKSLKMQRVNLLKEYSPSIGNSGYKNSNSKRKQSVSILSQDDSFRIMEVIKKRIKPFVNPNVFNYADILDQYVSLTEDRIGENVNTGSSVIRDSNEDSRVSKQIIIKNNGTTSKQELKKELSNLRQKFNQIEGKAKVYQQNELLKVNIEKIFQELKRICYIFLPHQAISQQEGFQSLLQKLQERVRLSLYNKSKNGSPDRNIDEEDYKIDLKQLQLKIEQQCKNNSSLKKINISLIQENQTLNKSLSQKERQLSQIRSFNYAKKKEQSAENAKIVQLKLEIEELRQKLKERDINFKQASSKIGNLQKQKQVISNKERTLFEQLRSAHEKIELFNLKQSSVKVQNESDDVKFLQKIRQLEEERKQMQNRYEEVLKKVEQVEQNRKQIQGLNLELQTEMKKIQQKHNSVMVQNDRMADQLMNAHQELQRMQQYAQKKQSMQIQALRNQIKQIQVSNSSFVKQLEEEIRSLQKQKQQLQCKLKHFETILMQKQQTLDELSQQKEGQTSNMMCLTAKIESQKTQIDNLNQRLQSMKLNDKSLKSKNVFLQQKIKQIQTSYADQAQELNKQILALIKQKQQIKLDLQLKINEFQKLKQKEENIEWQTKLQELRALVKQKNQQLRNLQTMNTELAQAKLKIMEKYTDLQEDLQTQEQQTKKCRQQIHIKQAQIQRISAQLLQKGQRMNRVQQQLKIRDRRIEELANQKARKTMNQRTYCNLIKRILRSQIQTQQFEDIEDFQKLLEFGSQKVMQQRKRKRQQQSNQRKQVTKLFDQQDQSNYNQNQQRNFVKAIQQHKITLFTQQIQSQEGQKSLSQFGQSQSDKKNILLSHQNLQQDKEDVKEIQNLDDFGDYKQQSLNQSLVSQTEDQPQENSQNQEKIQIDDNNVDQFNGNSNVNNSIIHNLSENRQQKEQSQKQVIEVPIQNVIIQQKEIILAPVQEKSIQGADFEQFNDQNTNSVNSSLISNQDEQLGLQKQGLIEGQNCKKECQGQQQCAEAEANKQEQKDLQAFSDYNSKLSNKQQQNTHKQQNQMAVKQADFNQFADIKSQKLNESMISIQQQKAQQKQLEKGECPDLSDFNDYKSDKLNDSIASYNQIKNEINLEQNLSGADLDQFGDYEEHMNSSMLSSQQQKIVALNKSSRSANSLSSKSLKSLKAGIQKMVSVEKIIQQKHSQAKQETSQANQFEAFNDYKSQHLNESAVSEQQQSEQKQKEEAKDFQQFDQFKDQMNSSLISQGQNQRQKMNEDLSAIQFQDAGSQGLGNSHLHLSQFFQSGDKKDRSRQKQKQTQQKNP